MADYKADMQFINASRYQFNFWITQNGPGGNGPVILKSCKIIFLVALSNVDR